VTTMYRFIANLASRDPPTVQTYIRDIQFPSCNSLYRDLQLYVKHGLVLIKIHNWLG